jgi:hypothetical protein
MTNPSSVIPSDSGTVDPGLLTASDYKITTLSLITSDGTVVDIKTLAVEINIYEDLFSPCMSGSILMGDALDLIANFKIHGHEWLIMEIDKPTLGLSLKKVFRVYKVSDRELKSQSLQNYILHFCSEELILSTQRFVSKSYKGMVISEMINDMLTNQLAVNPKKLGLMDKTEGIFNIIVPRMQPIEAIEWLSSRAYSSNGTLFMFYENRDGYNFQSYETLISRPVYQTYYKRPKLDTDPQLNWNSLNVMKIVQDFDLIASGRYGAFNSTLMTFDFVNRKVQNSQYVAGQGVMLNSSVPFNSTLNRFKTPLNQNPDYFLKFYPTFDSDPKTNASHPENWLHKKASRLAQLSSFKMVCTIPGDIALKVGSIVKVEVPQAVPQGDKLQINQLRTGKYLVSAVHHIFFNDVMSTVFELLSDSINGTMNPSSDSSQGMIAIKGS